MRPFFARSLAFAAAVVATPALAADDSGSAFNVSGAIALVSDYRFRGVSQSNNGFAIQGGITVTHESGFYGGFWSSNLAGWGTFGGPNLELDLNGGYRMPLGGGTLDMGVTWYTYPGGANTTDFVEPSIKLSGTAGPVLMLAGVAYAPKQQALGNWFFTGADYVSGVANAPNARNDNVYLWGDFSSGIPNTAATLKAHIGYSSGNPGLGPNGTSVAPTGTYWDWLIGVDYVLGPVTVGVAYVDTDISPNSPEFLRLQPNFSKDQIPGGDPISNGKVVFSVTAAF